MARWRPFVQGDSYMANKKWTPLVIGNGYTTTDGASGPAPEWETVTGNPVSFNAITPWPLHKLQVAFSPVQSGSGDPSPDNVRPISGWDSLTVEQRGKNLADDTDLKTSSYNIYHCPNPFKNSTQYTFSVFGTTPNRFRIMAAHTSEATPSQNIGVSSGYIYSGDHNTFITPADVEDYEYIYFAGNASGAGQSDALFVVTLGAEVPSSYTPYNPSSRSILISLGSTVYSGTVDVLTGVVTVDMEIVDLGAYEWTHYAASGVFRNLSIKSAANSKGVCTQYKSVLPVTWETQPDMSIQSGTADTVVKDSRYTDATAFKAAMDGVMFVHKLVTQQTFQLTPQEVQSLLGVNNLWSNANQPLTVTYRSN